MGSSSSSTGGNSSHSNAFLPEAGQALRDYAGGVALDQLVRVHGDGWRYPTPRMEGEDFFGVTARDDVAWMLARVGDHPYKTMTQPVQVTADSLNAVQWTYILTTTGPPFREAADRAKGMGFRSYKLFSADHDATTFAFLVIRHTCPTFS